MRIAYIAPYHGPTMLRRRPIVLNRSMAGTTKIEVIASLLRASSHDVEVISQGEVVENGWKFYPSSSEEEPFHPSIPVYYASALPIRRINGIWSNQRTLQLFKDRHRASPFDVVMVYNLKGPQLACANYAIRNLGIPVILEYEDDRFVNVGGEGVTGLALKRDAGASLELFQLLSGCIAVSPYLRAQLPAGIPALLLRGVIGADLISASDESRAKKKNIVLFAGTHIASNGIAQLIDGWRIAKFKDWELHITGYGQLTETLRQNAKNAPGVIFHGLVSRPELMELMASARICVNPHQVSQTPGNVFAFKLMEYLAAGAHVVTTPMGVLESDLEAGITYMPDNSPGTIASTLQRVIKERAHERTCAETARQKYGPSAVAKALDALLNQVRSKAIH